MRSPRCRASGPGWLLRPAEIRLPRCASPRRSLSSPACACCSGRPSCLRSARSASWRRSPPRARWQRRCSRRAWTAHGARDRVRRGRCGRGLLVCGRAVDPPARGRIAVRRRGQGHRRRRRRVVAAGAPRTRRALRVRRRARADAGRHGAAPPAARLVQRVAGAASGRALAVRGAAEAARTACRTPAASTSKRGCSSATCARPDRCAPAGATRRRSVVDPRVDRPGLLAERGRHALRDRLAPLLDGAALRRRADGADPRRPARDRGAGLDAVQPHRRSRTSSASRDCTSR